MPHQPRAENERDDEVECVDWKYPGDPAEYIVDRIGQGRRCWHIYGDASERKVDDCDEGNHYGIDNGFSRVE